MDLFHLLQADLQDATGRTYLGLAALSLAAFCAPLALVALIGALTLVWTEPLLGQELALYAVFFGAGGTLAAQVAKAALEEF